MRARSLAVSLLGLGAVTAACGLFDSEAELSHAAAMAGCGPADGPATVIVLAREPILSAQPPFPYVSVMILESISDLSPRTWDITTNTGPGVWYAVGPNDYQSATSGRVTVTSVDSTHDLKGFVQLVFPSRSVTTAFSARWLETAVLCG
jgi:hypothetical protein